MVIGGRDLEIALNMKTLRNFRIRGIEVAPATVLAPMAGVTDTIFRRMIRSLGGCGLIMTEFTSAEGVTRNAPRTLHYLYFEPDERPITAQLFGANARVMADAAKLVEDLGFDIVDINLGCPAKKVVKCGGSGLLRDLQELKELLLMVRRAVRIPLTIKTRAGWDEKSIVAVEVARMAEGIGVEAIAVHPRTRAQAYSGLADWNLIRAVKEAVTHPRHRQWRYTHARRCISNEGGNRMRCGHDRTRAPAPIHGSFARSRSLPRRGDTESRPIATDITCFPSISAI